MPLNKRQQLEQWTTVVADTGLLSAIKEHQPMDATTNPSLLLAVANSEDGKQYFSQAQKLAADFSPQAVDTNLLCDAFTVLVGAELLKTVPGLVSTEVDARLSFDTQKTIARARNLIHLYRFVGADSNRVLIKIAATWEGIQAAKVLEAEGITCNLTLIFHESQAIAAAQAHATLISPFVGRILDWHKKQGDDVSVDPGVAAVKNIFQQLKGMGSNTIVMGASFRNIGQIEALAGCDRLTISPALLTELARDNGTLTQQLDGSTVSKVNIAAVTEADYRFDLNQCAMSTDLLTDGIRRFVKDQQELEALLSQQSNVAA